MCLVQTDNRIIRKKEMLRRSSSSVSRQIRNEGLIKRQWNIENSLGDTLIQDSRYNLAF